MSFEDRVAAVEIATNFQENSNQIFKMVEEETDNAKTQVHLPLGGRMERSEMKCRTYLLLLANNLPLEFFLSRYVREIHTFI